jgi:hypothetical protein
MGIDGIENLKPDGGSVIDFNTASHVVDVLNRIHNEDPTVMPALIQMRVPCNRVLADDPTVQVGVIDGGFEVGILGIINGIIGIRDNGWGYIGARYDDEKNLTGFRILGENDV